MCAKQKKVNVIAWLKFHVLNYGVRTTNRQWQRALQKETDGERWGYRNSQADREREGEKWD